MSTTSLPSAFTVLQSTTAPVDRMIPVTLRPDHTARSHVLVRDLKRDAQRLAGTSWGELFGPLSSQGGCRYGCKVYARRQGAVVRFAVFHSSAYGHPRRSVTS